MNPQVFGWEHLTYLAVMLVLCAAATFLIKKYATDDKSLSIAVKSVAGLLLAAIIWNRISIVVRTGNPIDMLPPSFCGMSSLTMSIAALVGKKNCAFFHFICYISFIGGLLTMIYPDFIGQAPSLFYSSTISGLLHHTLLLYITVLMVLTRYFVPTIKKWYWLPLGLCCYMTYGQFLIAALGFGDAMQINNPLIEGTVFTWWFTSILVLALCFSIMAAFEYFNVWRPARAAKRTAAETEQPVPVKESAAADTACAAEANTDETGSAHETENE